MGVLNVTPDSFSDGGRFVDGPSWRARVDAMLEEGVDIIDVGGESTRPRAPRVPATEQMARVLEPIRWAARERGAVVSVDTTEPAVAAAALDAGAAIVNDVSCLADLELARVAASARATLVIMHSRGPMASMAGFSVAAEDAYADVVSDVAHALGDARGRAVAAGVPEGDVWLDPGLGFHKSAAHSYALLRSLSTLVALGAPLVVGASRKSFLARDVAAEPADRIGGSIAAALAAVRAGASVLRVHDVRATRQALAVDAAIRGGP